jgi:predicted NAD/FAD-binding protein
MFLQKRNLFSPVHWSMIRDILRFNKNANADVDGDRVGARVTLGDYLRPYGEAFRQRYLIPMGAAIWSTPSDRMHDFPARTFLRFFKNHGLLGVTTQHQWRTVRGGSVQYVNKIKERVSGRIVTDSDVTAVRRDADGTVLVRRDGTAQRYDKVILAMHAPDALALLEDPSDAEREILGAFAYKENDAVLHTDPRALYPDRRLYAAWNYKTGGNKDAVTLSYWINRLQNLQSERDYFVSLNETAALDRVVERIRYAHPQFDRRAIAAQARRGEISGVRNTYYAGAYWRYGFHEDGLWSANTIAAELGGAL